MRRIASSISVVVLSPPVPRSPPALRRPVRPGRPPALRPSACAASRRSPMRRPSSPSSIAAAWSATPATTRRASSSRPLRRPGARREQDAGLRRRAADGGGARGCSSTPTSHRSGAGKGFHPVLNGTRRRPRPTARGLMHRMLELKRRIRCRPRRRRRRRSTSRSIAATCPTVAEIDDYEREIPLRGMPFGLPALSETEHSALTRWIEQGAPYAGPAAPLPLAQQRVAQWEASSTATRSRSS